MKSTNKLTFSALFIASYIVIIFITSSFSFGAVQIRLANALYALSYLYPFLVLPTGIAVFLSNLLFGGLGIIDIIGGSFVGIITSGTIALLKKYNLSTKLIIIPILLIPALIVPIWLSPLTNIPYIILTVNLLLGNIIPSITGFLLVNLIIKYGGKYE